MPLDTIDQNVVDALKAGKSDEEIISELEVTQEKVDALKSVDDEATPEGEAPSEDAPEGDAQSEGTSDDAPEEEKTDTPSTDEVPEGDVPAGEPAPVA